MNHDAILKMGALPPKEAVEFLQGKTGRKVTYHWHELWQKEHNHQFTISRLTALDLLDDLHKSLVKSVNGEMGRKDWIEDTIKRMEGKGWWNVERDVIDKSTGEIVKTKFNKRRLHLIYDVNTRQAYAAGQWERIQRNKGVFTHIRYITKDDSRVRAAHRGWHNVVLPVDDPFWLTHYPPNGWRCRCRVVAVTGDTVKNGTAPNGEPLNTTRPDVVMRDYRNRTTGETIQIPAGIDAGFGYNPAIQRKQALDKLVADKIGTADESLAKAVAASGLLLSEAATNYVTKAIDSPKAVPPRLVLGTMNDDSIDQIEQIEAVSKRTRGIGLESSGLRHVNKKHGGENEALRGQVPVTAADIAAFDLIFNTATLKSANPNKDRDGATLISGETDMGDFRYYFTARVLKHLVVPKTMYKRQIKK